MRHLFNSTASLPCLGVMALLAGCGGKGGSNQPVPPATGSGGSGGSPASSGGSSGSGAGQGGSPGTGGTPSPGTGGTPSPSAGGAGGQAAGGVGGNAAPDSPGAGGAPSAAGAMRIFWIDVEGGQATLVSSPTGETLLADAGWAGARDSGRIAAVVEKELGKKQLDHLLVTHYHVDHVGGVGSVAQRLPVMQFIDHGSSVEGGDGGYRGAIGNSKRLSVKPGDKIMLGAVEIQILTSGGQVIANPAAAANPNCAGAQVKNDQQDEDPQSVGFIARYGKFEFVALGDLTWGVEHRLACPNNLVGEIELFQASQHGSAESNAPQLIRGLAPLVAVINNGASKGGSAMAFQSLRSSPGLKDIWQIHRASGAGNTEDALIANPGGADQAHWIKATIEADGKFTVTNGRTMESRPYDSR